MSWNIRGIRNLFFKLKSKSQLYHTVVITPKSFPGNFTLTVVEIQQLPDVENSDHKFEIACLKETKHNGRRKRCINFETDTDMLNIVVYRYRKDLYIQHEEFNLKLTENQTFFGKMSFPSEVV